jgi:hypothetical protein
LHELQRLQAVRAGEHVPAPAMVDINLDAFPVHSENLEVPIKGEHEGD